MSEFGVPGLLRVRVYTTEVFTAFAALYDFGRAVALALPLLVVCVAVASAAAVLLGDRFVVTRRSIGVSPVVFDSWRRPAAVAVAVVVAIAVALPVLTLTAETSSTRSLAAAVSGSATAIVNSLVFASVGASVVVGVAIWIGYTQARAGRVYRLAAQVLLVVLFAVRAHVGVRLTPSGTARPLGAYGTGVMALALARFMPVAALILAATASAIPCRRREAAAASSTAAAPRTIVLPQMRLRIAAAWFVAFVLAGELGVSVPLPRARRPYRFASTPSSRIHPSSHVAAPRCCSRSSCFCPWRRSSAPPSRVR